ncbi:MAG: fumarate hydratase C-terminal domain-containing protein [Dehalococcoidia bacterium]|nr:fumarate hydratase C-terminal domain-containing protein [Dehalococcoidia bacterium]
MKEVNLTIPIPKEKVLNLDAGDVVYITGVVYTARDMAHLRLLKLLRDKKSLPEDFNGGVIFHAGPVVKKEDGEWKIWVIGPTTSTRMEPYAEMVGELGVRAIVGKGGMGEDTIRSLAKYGGVYLLAAPGCGVIHSGAVKKVLRVHWLEELGVPEAIWVLEVNKWGPLIVGMDSHGRSIFKDIAQKATTLKEQWFRS